MADWLAYGLEDALADTPEFGVVRKHRTTSGLIRYDTRSETQDWAQAAREAIAADQAEVHRHDGRSERPAVDPRFVSRPRALRHRRLQPLRLPPLPRQHRRPRRAPRPQHQPIAAETLSSRDARDRRARAAGARRLPDATNSAASQWAEQYTKRIDATIAALKTANVPVFWVGLPSIRGHKSTSDMQYLDELYR